VIWRRFISILIMLSCVSACSGGIDNSRLRVDVIEDTPHTFNTGLLPLPKSSAYLRSAATQGLVTFDKEGRVIPALASRWIVTDDGMSYIFRLNKTTWNDGKPVTADKVALAINTRISELRPSIMGRELSAVERAVPMTGKVVEIRLKAPAPNLLELLAQPEFGIVRKGVGSGPMQSKKQGSSMQLRMRGLDEKGKSILLSERLTLTSNAAAIALARFKAGQTDLVTAGQFQHLPALEAAKAENGTIQFDPVPGLFGLLIVKDGPFLSNEVNRDAIAKAIDRPKLLSSFGLLAWQETFTIVPESMANRASVIKPEWTNQNFASRRIQARQTIARWKSTNGAIRPLRIGLPNGAGSRILFARLRSDFAAIGLRIERATYDQDPDINLIDRIADISSPSWYLAQLSCQSTVVCDAQADGLVAAARLSPNKADRQRLLGEAETRLQTYRNYIPLANPISWSLTRDGLKGYAQSPRGWHLLQNLGRGPT
jgi:ABC-type transport system substrate-binding protein